MAAEFCLRNISIHARKVLLHAVNLRHGTDGFTSPPKKVVLRIFITLKNTSGLNPQTLGPVVSTLTTSPPSAILFNKLKFSLTQACFITRCDGLKCADFTPDASNDLQFTAHIRYPE